MLIYRIVHKAYSKELRASGMAGRWNREGKKVIYCAESIALAFLENMVRRQGVGFNSDFKIMFIDVPGSLKFALVKVDDLKDDWRNFTDYSRCQAIGDDWYNEGRYPLLKVPSAVLPEAFNYVLNTAHPAFVKVKLLETTPLVPDERIEEILKKHRG